MDIARVLGYNVIDFTRKPFSLIEILALLCESIVERMITIKSKIIFGLITIVIPLAIGAVLYYLLCPDVWFVKVIDSSTNLNVHLDYEIGKNTIIMVVRNHFFDYLWAFAFTNAIYLLYNNNNHKALLTACVLSVTIGCVLEVLQYIGIVQGTFDFLDILSELLGAVVAVLVLIKNRRN